MTDRKLTPGEVHRLFEACRDRPGAEDREGILTKAALNTDGFEEDIRAMLLELPTQFRERSGGGWTFLNACENRWGELWTGEHRTMDMLFMLGEAAGLSGYVLGRDFWKDLPGRMPYIWIKEPPGEEPEDGES